ncbi:2-amino-4-deoxychorismate dehydrogenase [Clostridiales bacterium]|nr:2-amino-4-deoxychorismate dehydrogenase [Clostridiales bacterium]
MSGKNILIITGSPRVDGNSDRLADAFIDGAVYAENNVVRFDAGRMNIGGCKACDTCFTKRAACSVSNGFNTIAAEIEKSDVIVFVTPMYWFSFTSQIKDVIDKFYSFSRAGKDISGKESILIVCGGTADKGDFEGIITTYNLILNHLKWENLGVLTVPNVNEKGEVKATGALEKAEEMGKNI